MSSTAVAPAIPAPPGRATVHIWSSVRSASDCLSAQLLPVRTYVGGRHDIAAEVAAEWLIAVHAVPHDEVRVKAQRCIDHELHVSEVW